MAENRKTPFLFVYGTLMRGIGEDWPRKVGARVVARGKINARLYDLGDYPGVVWLDDNSEEWVTGELYKLSDPDFAMRILDEYEQSFPTRPERSLFVRRVVPVTLSSGRKRKAWVYFYNRPVDAANLIRSGDYRDAVAEKRRQNPRARAKCRISFR